MAGPVRVSREELDRLYTFYNHSQWVHPDPLEFLYRYPSLEDREIAGLIASSLAYGRVRQILQSVGYVLDQMGPSPFAFLKQATVGFLQQNFVHFKHRFTSGEELVLMLWGIKQAISRYGSLYSCFLSGFHRDYETVLPGLETLVREILRPLGPRPSTLLPDPAKGSACKRLNLFLRWMVRRDRVDPGGWEEIRPAALIVPLDTHMHRIALKWQFTCRRHGTLQTAMEITRSFREIAEEDPVRYDFALTRLGIRKDPEAAGLIGGCDVK